MKKVSVIGVVLGALSLAGPVWAGDSGEEVYKQTCSRCHDTGKMGAPQLGNMEEWTDVAGWVWSDVHDQHLEDGLVKDKQVTAEQFKAGAEYMASMVGQQ